MSSQNNHDPEYLAHIVRSQHEQAVEVMGVIDQLKNRQSRHHWFTGPHKVYTPFEGEAETLDLNLSAAEDALWVYLDGLLTHPEARELAQEAIDKLPWGRGEWKPRQWSGAHLRIKALVAQKPQRGRGRPKKVSS